MSNEVEMTDDSIGKVIYSSSKGPVYQKDIEISLKKAGLKEGDVVMVHSDIKVIGKIGDLRNREEFLNSIVDAFMNVLGKEGTLVLPTFTYSFCENKTFDVRNTPSSVGLLGEFVRKMPEAVRSVNPIFSCTAIGAKKNELLCDLSKNCFGQGSFFDKFHKLKGKLLLYGRPFDVTYLHYVEKLFGVEYRYPKKFSGTIIDEDGNKYEDNYEFFVRYIDIDVTKKMDEFGEALFEKGCLQKVELGDHYLLFCTTEDAFRVGMEMLQKNPHV